MLTNNKMTAMMNFKEDKPNYGNSILHERIKTFVLGKVPFEWTDTEMDNLREEVEKFVDVVHARIDGLNT